MTHKIIRVEGMTCGHCVETVTNAVNNLTGITQVKVDLDNKQVSVNFDESQINLDKIASKITEMGFEVISD